MDRRSTSPGRSYSAVFFTRRKDVDERIERKGEGLHQNLLGDAAEKIDDDNTYNRSDNAAYMSL